MIKNRSNSNTQQTSDDTNSQLSEKCQKITQPIISQIDNDFEKLKSTEIWEMGIDEAGRGPVLGPMVYGCCLWPSNYQNLLHPLGFDDSKKLTEDKRDYFFQIIQNLSHHLVHYEVIVISPEYISSQMQNPTGKNLNQISFDTAYQLIYSVMGKGFNVNHIYIDTVGSPQTYQSKLYNDFSNEYPQLQFTVSEKADSKFPVVSAASICAKVTRDQEIRQFQFKESFKTPISREFGSGYPSDPNTKKWLQENYNKVFGFPSIVRFSWQTIQTIMNDNQLEVKFPNEEIDKNQMSIDECFQTKKSYLVKQMSLSKDFSL